MKGNGINSAFIEENNIKLLKKDGKYSNMKGFIGGACFIFDNKFVLFGEYWKFRKQRKNNRTFEKIWVGISRF